MTKYNFKLNKRRSLIIAYTAILIALDMVLNTVALDIGYLSIAFTYIPCFVAGMFFRADFWWNCWIMWRFAGCYHKRIFAIACYLDIMYADWCYPRI